MRYTVKSGPGVDDKLAAIWLVASDPQALSIASNQIDTLLAQTPLAFGVPVDNYRVLRIDPLTVLYSVSEPDRAVTIWDYSYRG